MEKDVVKYLRKKGKSEQFINLILKILKDERVKKDIQTLYDYYDNI